MSNRAERRAAERRAAEQGRQANAARTPVAEPIEQPPVAATFSLSRHNGSFHLLPSENAIGFEALRQTLLDEHQPTTPTESILVNCMAESHWLANRAQLLTDSCLNQETCQVENAKLFALYLRYQSTHTRAFHKSLNDLLKLRAERRKSEIGFEAQKVATERHEMKKQTHYWDVLKKDAQAATKSPKTPFKTSTR